MIEGAYFSEGYVGLYNKKKKKKKSGVITFIAITEVLSTFTQMFAICENKPFHVFWHNCMSNFKSYFELKVISRLKFESKAIVLHKSC